MDSGYLEPGESLRDEYDILQPLTPSEAMGIMDQILCHEVGRPPCHFDDLPSLRSPRSHGIQDIHYRKQSLHVFI